MRLQYTGMGADERSGKSSSIQAILRMIDVSAGQIVLDGVDLANVSPPDVRERLICLTQDPFLFSASVRMNADPLAQSSDEAIVDALKKVNLWEVLQQKADTTGQEVGAVLDTLMDAEFLSHGQRQLFCLARALLKQSKVLILDEPTSRQVHLPALHDDRCGTNANPSVDSKTDAQMQQVIRSEFRDHTVIMIAHRLSTLVDFDHILVLDHGELIEQGAPRELLKNPAAMFTKLYHTSMGGTRSEDVSS
jgi:ATP-binding cassette, subfamily C (CFTR/MRP), member 1